jgi:DNA-binding transcriptional LysR family regulator
VITVPPSSTVPGLYLYYSSRRYMLPALRPFIDCLLNRDINHGSTLAQSTQS